MHRIQVDKGSGATVVIAEGELDAYAAPDLTAVFADASGDGNVVVDLNAVSFMDSTALGLVVRAVRELSEEGRAVRVVLPEAAARRIFEITTLDRVLPTSPTRADALSELAGRERENG